LITLILQVLAAFLIGSIPFAKIAMLGTGIDITKVGSKNPGFNNVLRVSSKWRAAIALIGDISKGYIALWLLHLAAPVTPPWFVVIAPVVGHCWSPWLKFNGGKGVATTVGILLYMDPLITVACLPLYVILRFIGRKAGWRQEGAIASLSTMLLISVIVGQPYAYAMFAIVVIRHIPNLREITASKRESRSEQSKSRSGDAQAAPRQSR
jgi:acyl phosphate:glycerol-3-phosphate acyltransferase